LTSRTLAVSIAVASMAYKLRLQEPSRSTGGIQVLVFFPNTHLLHQVERDLLLLDPSFFHPEHPFAPHEEGPRLFTVLITQDQPGKKGALLDAGGRAKQLTVPKDIGSTPALLATPKDFMQQKDHIDVDHVRTVFVDEPDAMMPQLPGRHMNSMEIKKLAINRHPPPLVHAMNLVLGIRDTREGQSDAREKSPKKKDKRSIMQKSKERVLALDFSGRKDIQTIWTSGTLDSALRRFTKTRGWIRTKDHLVDLNFAPLASQQQVEIREHAMNGAEGEEAQVRTDPITSITGVEPEHYALTVDVEDGGVRALTPAALRAPKVSLPPPTKGGLQPTMVEALGLLHTASPPPPGTYALAVCPEGTSLDTVQAELTSLGIASLHLRPEILHDISVLEPEEGDEAPIFLARRSVVPGLHLPRLHTIYLLNGLDIGEGVKSVAIRDRVNFYEVAAGRVGRLGMGSGTQGEQGSRQRVISIVNRGTADETLLGELFFGQYSVRPGQEKELKQGSEVVPRWRLAPWDEGEFKRTVRALIDAQ
jgi:hypothetical protein